MNAKKVAEKASAPETEREVETVTLPPEAVPPGPSTPATPETETQPSAEPAADDNAGHVDTTNMPEPAAAPVAEEPIIDLADDGVVKKVVLGGGADMTINEPSSPIGITQPMVPPVEDVAEIKTTSLPKDELNKLDETDSARAAAIRNQAAWPEDAKKIFKGPTEAELERSENIRQMDELDARERRRVDEEKRVKGIATERDNAAATMKALESEYAGMVDRAKFIKLELERLGRLLAGGDEPREIDDQKEAA